MVEKQLESLKSTDYETIDANVWAKESYEMSISNVYPGAQAGHELSSEYIQTNVLAAHK
jgi:hypothetical protein